MFAVKYVCLISHETNGLIMIPKTVLKSGLWRCSKKYGFNSNCQENYLKLGSWCGFKSGFAFCKICLPNLARGYLSDHDSENCSEISAVTWSGIFFNFFKILTFVFFTPPYYIRWLVITYRSASQRAATSNELLQIWLTSYRNNSNDYTGL